MPFERNLANMALHAKVQKEMPKTVPIEANEANYLAGAHEYLTNCAVCHGVPGKEKTAIARGEFPIPPSYSRGKASPTIRPARHFGKWRMEFG
jgi:mono/diheme cytochrome c family protein